MAVKHQTRTSNLFPMELLRMQTIHSQYIERMLVGYYLLPFPTYFRFTTNAAIAVKSLRTFEGPSALCLAPRKGPRLGSKNRDILCWGRRAQVIIALSVFLGTHLPSLFSSVSLLVAFQGSDRNV